MFPALMGTSLEFRTEKTFNGEGSGSGNGGQSDRIMQDSGNSSTATKREQQEVALRSFEQRLEKLRVDFDQFFMGILKVPPTDARDKLQRDLRFSDLRKSNNTAVRFRFQNLTQKLTTYSTFWERTMRQREDGTFRKGPRDRRS